ncbi:MAG: adenylate/guanylate cyclase domain-containing protein [Desulfuromonas sp.]|nr:MAG: adenylate/guanylate cyclase domain-containing protein [Desulfuromonas sp.]
MGRSKILIIVLTLLMTFGCAALYYQQNSLLEAFEEKTYDFRYATLRGGIPVDPSIVIVALDEKSIGELGRFPWSRTEFARFVTAQKAAGAKAVFMDVFFPEAESAHADGAFAEALAAAGNVHLATAFEFAADGSVSSVVRSLPALRQASGPSFHVNLVPDADGVVRWTPLYLVDEDEGVPSLALAASSALLGVSPEPSEYGVTVGESLIPTDSWLFTLINYASPPGSFAKVSFVDVVEGRVGEAELRDKILLVGATALGIYDMRVTPFSNNSPGVEVHANIIDSILHQRFMQRGSLESIIDLIGILLLGVVAAFITLSLRHSISLPLIVLLLLAHGGFAYAAFLRGHWLSMVYPTLSVLVAFSATAYLRFFFLDRKTKQIRGMFSSYVSSKVVDQLVRDPSQARIGGESRTVTILFSDVQNYTGFSENLPPQEVVRVLNQYLAEMTHIIMDQEGTLDKFIGDGIMSFWGAPVEQPNHAELAVDCGLRMIAKMEELGAQWQARGETALSLRIGLNSGEVVVGNIGAEGKKMEYTVIGDNVNLASRIEGINKPYGTRLMITEATRQLLPSGVYRLREIDCVRVKGKQVAQPIFEVLDKGGVPAPWESAFASALTLYRERRFGAAEEAFAALVADYDDPPSRLYVERCRLFREEPPPEGWDGSFTAREK